MADNIVARKETWKPVVGWEGLYEVSDHGQVRSLDREVIGKAGAVVKRKGRILKPGRGNSAGYPSVNLSRDGKTTSAYVHRLVLEAFEGPGPEGAYVLHYDDDPANNMLSNLRYGSQKENVADSVRNGARGKEKTHCVHGHEYTEENTYRSPSGGRRCRACDRERQPKRSRDEVRTRCKRGHEFNEENSYVAPSGGRQCRPCRRARMRKRYQERRAA